MFLIFSTTTDLPAARQISGKDKQKNEPQRGNTLLSIFIINVNKYRNLLHLNILRLAIEAGYARACSNQLI